MGLPYDKLTVWIKSRLTNIDIEDDEGKATCRFELYHAVDGEGMGRVHTMPVTSPMNAAEAAQEFYGCAESDAETRTSGVPQRYVIGAFCESEREPTHSFAFVVKSNPLSYSKLLGQDTEPPTDKGMIAHVMRHDETMHRMMMVMTDATAGKLAHAVAQKDERIQYLEEKMMSSFEMYQKLLDRSQDRELERAEAVQRAKRMDEMMSMAMAYVPMFLGAVAGKLAPKGLEPLAKSKQRDDGIRQLLSNLSEDEVMKVMGSLKPMNQAQLVTLFQSYQEDVKKEQEGKPEILREAPEAQESES